MRHVIYSLIIITVFATSVCAKIDTDDRLNRVVALHAQKTRNATQGAPEFKNPELTPMLAEIKAVLDSSRVIEAELMSRHPEHSQNLPGSPLVMALAAHKKATHLEVLHIQARFAHLEGRTELEQRILSSIADFERPATPGVPGMQPVPVPTAGPISNQR
jgi:hypothetical protein